jgi:hypothetical protein
MNRIFLALVFAALSILGGCATYTPSLAKLDATGAGATKQSVSDVTVFVDEYVTKAKSEKTFDMDLRSDGVLPLLVTLQNGGKLPVDIKTMDITLRDGTASAKLLSPEEAATKAKKSAAGRAIGWSLIVPIISIPIAATASVMHTNKVNRQIMEDFTAKSFASETVAPGKEKSGFLYFDIDKLRSEFAGLVLEMKMKIEGAADPITISAPLSTIKVEVPAQAQPR